MRSHRRRDTGLAQMILLDHTLLGTHFGTVLNSFPEHKSQITLLSSLWHQTVWKSSSCAKLIVIKTYKTWLRSFTHYAEHKTEMNSKLDATYGFTPRCLYFNALAGNRSASIMSAASHLKTLLVLLLLCLIICRQGICDFVPETNHVSGVCNVAAVL